MNLERKKLPTFIIVGHNTYNITLLYMYIIVNITNIFVSMFVFHTLFIEEKRDFRNYVESHTLYYISHITNRFMILEYIILQ